MFDFKIDGVLEIGSSGIKVILQKKNKIEKLHYVDYEDMNEDKIIVLQDALEGMTKKVKLSGKNFVVTIPASNFSVKTLEYDDLDEDETLEERMESDLEEIIVGYSRDSFVTQIEKISETKILAVTISEDEIEKILSILGTFKIRILKIMPDFIALNNIVNFLIQEKEEAQKNIAIIDIGGESSKILLNSDGIVNMVRIIGIGGNDFTEIISEHEMLDYQNAELEKYKLEIGESEEKVYKTQGEVTMFRELTDVANELVHQIGDSLEYFNSNLKEKNITKIYATGGGALLKGFRSYFDATLSIRCEKIDLDLLNLKYKNTDIKNFISSFRMATLLGAFVKRGEENEKYEFFNRKV